MDAVTKQYGSQQSRPSRRVGRPPAVIENFTPDPDRWPDDGGAKRVGIYDHICNPPRLVRRVGWTNCLGESPTHRIFSFDVARERICTTCKTRQSALDLFQPRNSRGAGKVVAPVDMRKAPSGAQLG